MGRFHQSHSTVVLGAVLCCAPLVARAATPADKAAAESLFASALALLSEKKFSEACPKLEESQRLDPASGTLLNLAWCHEMEGKTATAWAEYKKLLALADAEGRVDRSTEAK